MTTETMTDLDAALAELETVAIEAEAKPEAAAEATVDAELEAAMDLSELDDLIAEDEAPAEEQAEPEIEAKVDDALESDLEALDDLIGEEKSEDSELDDALSELEDLEPEAEPVATAEVGTFPVPEAEQEDIELPEETAEVDTTPEESEEETGPDVEVKAAPAEPAKPKARAHGATNPYDRLVARMGSKEAVANNTVLTTEDADRPVEELDAEFKEIVNKLAKKVGEKAVNLMAHLQGTAKLSIYTELAIEMLVTDGTLTSKDLFDKYRARPYSEGTSRSQCGQLMQLLPALKIAKSTGRGSLELNEDSVIASIFKETMAPAEEAA